MPHRVVLAAGLVPHQDFLACHEGVVYSRQQDHIALFDPVVIGGIRELECEDAEIGEVLPVDPRERDGYHCAQPEEARGDCRVFP